MKTVLEILVLLAYANIVEYAVHRWALHGWLWDRHIKHHLLYSKNVFFVRDAGGVTAVLLMIAASSLLFSFWGWLPLLVFSVYYFGLIEFAHFLIHADHLSKHHMTHHADLQPGNYNIWIPFGDYLFGTKI